MENQRAPGFSLPLVDGGEFALAAQKQKRVLLFWATWCGPCSLELARVNRMIAGGELKPEQVLAISIGETAEVVKSAIAERKYTFPVALDLDGKVAESFKVSGTPTIVFVDEKQVINWLSTGLSPSLGLRLQRFLRE